MSKISRAFRRRLGPVGLSLAAAAVTAIGFAAISVADEGEKGGGESAERAGPPGIQMFGERLSEEDRAKLEGFRQCMQDQGAPEPPRPGESDGPPEPPSSEELDQIRKAHEACEDELPEDLRERGFPPFGGPCGPPPGAERADEGRED